MKKLMMFAAAMTIVGGAYASVCAPGSEASPCDTPVWDFVMKGKTANGIEKGYKAVYAISYKGAIVGNLSEVTTSTTVPGTKLETTDLNVVTVPGAAAIVAASNEVILAKSEFTVQTPASLNEPTAIGQTEVNLGVTIESYETVAVSNTTSGVTTTTVSNLLSTVTKDVWIAMVDDSTTTVEPTGECCLDTFTVYVYDKDAKDLLVFEDQEVLKMSVFGKGMVKELKPGQSASLESDVMWNLVGDEEIALQFVGFGKAKYGLSKGGTSGSVCNPVTEVPCVPSYDWPSWSGWFTGFFGPETDDSHDLNCAGECVAVAGGTWSAKLNKKLSAASDVEGAIYRKFKVSYLFDDFE